MEISLAGGRSVVWRCRANSPLKLLCPRTQSHASWVFVSTYGGGLVGGDQLQLDVKVGPAATALLATQSSTKVYPRRDGKGCGQTLTMSIAEGGLAVVVPDPIVCFAESDYVQRQRFDLKTSAGLVLIDSLSSGRRARGERWAMHRYEARNDVYVEGEHLFRDALILDPVDGPLSGVHRMGCFDCIVMVVLIGEPLKNVIAALSRDEAAGELHRQAPGPVALSPIRGGLILRAVADGPEAIGHWLRRLLDFVPPMLGEDPWARKW